MKKANGLSTFYWYDLWCLFVAKTIHKEICIKNVLLEVLETLTITKVGL